MWFKEKDKVRSGVDFEGMGEYLRRLKEFIDREMVEGVDYGHIYDEDGNRISEKPILFKAGAEKLARLFGLRVEYRVEKREDWDKGFFVYEVEAKGFRDGEYVASGYGIASSKERRFEEWDVYELPNALVKLAKKRALVDLVLTATASSSFFSGSVLEESDEGISESQRRYMRKLARDKGLEWEFVKENIIKPLTGKESSKDLTKGEATKVIDALRRWEEKK